MSNCDTRYAEAWQYAAYWCQSSLLTGFHEGAGPADLDLLDNTVDFLRAGAAANTGQILYNVTQSTNGKIISANANTLRASGVTWNNGDEYRSAFLTTAQRALIEMRLDLTAGPIHAALASVAACNCTLSTWGANFLATLNIVQTKILYDCPCSSATMSDAEKRRYADMVSGALEQIRTMKIDVCEGGSGADYPVTGFAERSWNDFAAAEIIVKDLERNGNV